MNEQNSSHNLFIENRNIVNLTGVKEVLSFSDDTIDAATELGEITLRGTGLKINNFSDVTGDLSASGNIVAVVYNGKTKDGFFSRLFR